MSSIGGTYHIIGGLVGIDAEDVLKVVQEYSRSLELLDAYDHQCVAIPEGSKCSYMLRHDECIKLIKSMEFSQTSDVFGVEKEIMIQVIINFLHW